MDSSVEKDSNNLGSIFQQIVGDLKNGTPLWDDFISKATKLHTCLKATIQAIAAYLDAFQKIADAATNARGATKDLGTALTRICLRHKAVETKMKTFTSAVLDCLITPLQEKLDDWKRNIVNLDRDYAKDYKKARAELKKCSTDTLRLQKKARKGGKAEDLQKALWEVSEKKCLLEEAEKKAVREALIEERKRYCLFVTFLKPVVDEEISMLSELSHLQEAMDQLEKHAADPGTLPAASEEVISSVKGMDVSLALRSPAPSSPSSLGSRKSSVCSISSLNSSSSGSNKSHLSPNHMFRNHPVSQRFHSTQVCGAYQLGSVSSQDSGFISQDALYITRNSSTSFLQQQGIDLREENDGSRDSTSSLTLPTSAWPNLQDTLQFEKAASAILNDRPHTISSAYEKGHQRPPLSVYTFQMPVNCQTQPCSPSSVSSCNDSTTSTISSQHVHAFNTFDYDNVSVSSQCIYARPPVPLRNSSLERPTVPGKPQSDVSSNGKIAVNRCSLSDERIKQPLYANTRELANVTSLNRYPPSSSGNFVSTTESQVFHNEKSEIVEKESSTSESSLESSSGYGSQSCMSGATPTPEFENTYHEGYCTIKSGTLSRRGSVQTAKPAPPVRRTSSILSGSKCSSVRNSVAVNTESLPPPPAFLLETANPITSSQMSSPTADVKKNVANCIAAEVQKRHILSTSVFADQLKSATAQRIYAAPVDHHRFSITTIHPFSDTSHLPQHFSKADENLENDTEIKGSRSVSVAEAIRTLTEMNHQPASPVTVRRNSSLRSSSAERQSERSLISALSARITPSVSPRNSRKYTHEFGKSTLPRANRVRQWIALRTVTDPSICRASLMDQIRKGTHLRSTSSINDRSAPKIS